MNLKNTNYSQSVGDYQKDVTPIDSYRKTNFSHDPTFFDWCGKSLTSAAEGMYIGDIDICQRLSRQKDGFEHIQFIEIKRRMAEPKNHQRVLMQMLHGIFRMADGESFPIKLGKSNFSIKVKFHGVHLLQFEKENFTDGGRLYWDRQEVSQEQLISKMNFEDVGI